MTEERVLALPTISRVKLVRFLDRYRWRDQLEVYAEYD